MQCPKCGSKNVRYNNTILRQNRAKERYRCKNCKKTFYNEEERILTMKGEIGYILSREIRKRILLQKHGIFKAEKSEIMFAVINEMEYREENIVAPPEVRRMKHF